jgi:hypothetical protein
MKTMEKKIQICTWFTLCCVTLNTISGQSYKIQNNDIIINEKEYVLRDILSSERFFESSQKYDDIFYIFAEPYASITKIDYTFQFQYAKTEVMLVSELKELIMSPNIDHSIQYFIIHGQKKDINSDLDYSNIYFEKVINKNLYFSANMQQITVRDSLNTIPVFYTDGTFLGLVKKTDTEFGINLLENLYQKHFYSMEIIKDVTKWNDIGYYLEQGHFYSMATDILTEVLKINSNRVVAYLNLADAQWGNGDKSDAKKSYQKYVELMKSQGKDLKKIPQRVYDRIK